MIEPPGATRREATLVAVGDIMLGASIAELIESRGPHYPFAEVGSILQGADIAFGNLEVPIAERDTPVVKDYVFRAELASVEGLVWAGFDVLSFANNHAYDHGRDGLLSTLTVLNKVGIAPVGAGADAATAYRPVLLTVNGLRVAFLAYVNVPDDGLTGFSLRRVAATEDTPGVAWGTVEAVARGITEAKRHADVIVVSLHSGYEFQEPPNAIQRELAYAAIDAGAALVLGHHPHVIQGIEEYKGGLIAYSLGNFVFEFDAIDFVQPGLPSALSMILTVTLNEQGVAAYQIIPVRLDPKEGRPLLAEEDEAHPVRERLERLSRALASSP